MSQVTSMSLLLLALTSSAALAENPSNGPVNSEGFSVLTYPTFSELKPLPKRTYVAPLPIPEPTAAIQASSNSERELPSVSEPALNAPKPADTSNEPFGLDDLDLSGLDPEIARKVAAAMSNEPENPLLRNADHIALESNEARYRGRLPALNLQTHMYSSDTNRRWIKVNGQELKEGDRLNSIQLLAIEPQSITIRFDNDIIDIPALYEWGG